ncbi:MAG: type II secretion system protein [Pirellulales bacterium]|nr:type II secretion system protein [Pirellulales bacterium]
MTLYKQQSSPRGFTLVEILVVISIIGLLAGLITAGAIVAINSAKRATITTDLSQLDMALKNAKTKLGDAYPPDGTNTAAANDANNNNIPDDFERYFRSAFPKANLISEIQRLQSNYNIILDFTYYTPQTAMIFWLGGMPEDLYNANRLNDSTTRSNLNPLSPLIGFSKNPLQPLSDPSTSRIGPFFQDLQNSRLGDPCPDPNDHHDPRRSLTIFRTYRPPVTTSSNTPYLYFRAESQRATEYCLPGTNILKTIPGFAAKPYWDVKSQGFVNPKSFQLLCAGLDGEYGSGNAFNTGIQSGTLTSPYNDANTDDQTNFIQGTIGNAVP